MDDGVPAPESGVVDQGPEDEDLKSDVAAAVAVAVASGGEVAVDPREGTAEASSRRSRAKKKAASGSMLRR